MATLIMTQKMKMVKTIHHNNILITGAGGPAGRLAVTYFKARSFSVTGADIRSDDPDFTALLMDIIRRERPSLLIPTLTENLPVISSIKREIEWEGCTVLMSSPTAIEIANDRLKTAMIMAGHGIAVPKFCDEVTPVDIIVDKLGLPLLAKPRTGSGSRKVSVYRRYEELFETSKEGLIFQEYISGAIYNLNMFIDRGGSILSAVVLEKTALNNGNRDSILSVERVDRPDIVKLGTKAAGILNLEGPVEMDIGLRNNFTPVLLDINARLGRNSLFAWEILDCLLDTWKRSLLTGNIR